MKNVEKYRPSQIITSICDINFEELYRQGLRKAMFDLDGTLVPNMSYNLNENVVSHILEARQAGWLEDCCIISNCALWFLAQRVEDIAKALNMKWQAYYWPNFMKPEPPAFEAGMQLIGGTVENTIMVGNQIERDIPQEGYLRDMNTYLVQTIGKVPWWKQGREKKQNEIMKQLKISFPIK
jgi:predicted HAD superfamily phosphohydrolase YqeG